MSCVRNVLFCLLSGLAIFANLSCVAVKAPHAEPKRTNRVDLQPCRFANHPSGFLCAKYPVFEDRAVKAGRMIPLNIAVLTVSDTRSEADDCSGSLLVEDVATNPRALGLLFAGSVNTTIINRIQNVFQALQVTLP